MCYSCHGDTIHGNIVSYIESVKCYSLCRIHSDSTMWTKITCVNDSWASPLPSECFALYCSQYQFSCIHVAIVASALYELRSHASRHKGANWAGGPHIFKIPYHLFAHILLVQHITYPPPPWQGYCSSIRNGFFYILENVVVNFFDCGFFIELHTETNFVWSNSWRNCLHRGWTKTNVGPTIAGVVAECGCFVSTIFLDEPFDFASSHTHKIPLRSRTILSHFLVTMDFNRMTTFFDIPLRRHGRSNPCY